MLKKVSSYIKNVGRSVVFSMSDIITEDNKFLYEFKETNQELAKNAYNSVKKYKQTFNTLESSFKTSKVYQAADIGMRAIFEDLRTGKFYNKERIDEVQTSLGGFDMTDDFDMEEFEKSMKNKEDISGGDKAIISTLTNTSRQNAELVSGTVARSTEAMIGNQRASTKMLYAQNIQLIGGVHSAIESLNGVGRTINGTNTMLKTMADNQKKFYETTNKQLTDLTALMKELTEMQRNLYTEKREAQKKSKGPGYDDIITSSGALDITQYIKNIKRNASNKINDTSLGMLFNGFGGDSNMLAQFTASPLQFIPELILKGLIPKATREASKSLSKSLSGVFSTLIGRLNNMSGSDNAITKLIGDIFGVKIKTKTTIDNNKYNKGPVPFDGIVRKSIIDVIPGYLRRIEAALTGTRGRAFDYETGKWVELSQAKKKFEDDFDKYKENTFSEFVAFRDELLKDLKMGTLEQQKQFEENQRKILRDMYDHNGDWTRYTKRGDDYRANLARDIGVDENDIKVFAKIMKSMLDADTKRARNIQYGMADAAIRAKQSRTAYMQSLEDRGGNIIGTAMEDSFNDRHVDKHGIPLKGTLGAGILKVRDEYNHDMFHYLRSLDENVKWIQRFVEMNKGLGGGGGGSNQGSSVRMPSRTAIENERGTRRLSPHEVISEAESRESDTYDNYLKETDTIVNYYDEDFGKKISTHFANRAADISLREESKEKTARSWFRDLFDDGSTPREYSSDKLIDQLKEAQTIGEKYGLIKKSMEKLAEAPMNMLTNVIKKADESVYHFMFGDADEEVDEDGNPIRGLLAKTIHEMKNTFSKLNQWLNEKLLDPLKAKLDEWGIHSFTDALDKITGGRFSDAKNAIADTVFGTKDANGKRHGGWIDPMRSAWRRNFDRFTEKEYRAQAPIRRKVAASDKKYSEFKTRDLSSTPLGLMEAEAEYDTGMFHSFGTAGRVKKDMLSMLSEGEYLIDSRNNVSRVTAEQARSPQFISKGTTIYNPADAWTRAAQSSLEKANLARYINSNAEAAEGTEKPDEGDAKVVNVALKKWLSEHSYDSADPKAKKWVEGMVDTTAKTGIGAISGFLLGNPLLGATFGAIAGIAKNNSSLNQFLFGGEKDTGIISRKTQEWLKESMPRAKNFGIIGAIGGLLTGLGPIPGLLIGSAAAFASKNEELMTTLFGDTETRAERMEKLKAALPRMGVGAAAGALLGPFGLLGGAALGAAGGLFTTTDTFDQLMFGEKDENGERISGGVMGALKESFIDPLKNWAEDFKTRSKEFIRDYIADPIKGAIKPIGTAMVHLAKSAVTFVPNMIDKVFTNYLGIPLGDFLRDKVFNPMAKLAKGIFTLPATLLKGALMLPGKVIGGIGNRIRESQIRRGTADYMSAEERMAYREQHSKRFQRSLFHPFRRDRMLETDQRLQGADATTIGSMLDSMNTVLDTESKLKSASKKAQRDLATFVDQYFHDKLFRGAKTRILKALDKGDLQGALKIASKVTDKDGNTLSGEKFVEFQEGLTERWNAVRDLKGRMNALGQKRDKKSALAETQKQLANLGITNIKLNTVKDQRRFADMLNREKRAKLRTLDDDLHENGALISAKNDAINDKLVEVLANLAGVSQTLLSAANAFKNDPGAFAESSKGLSSVYEDLDTLAKDETIGKGMQELARHAANKMKNTAFADNQNKAKAAAFGNRMAREGEALKAWRVGRVRAAGIEPDLSGDAGKYWSMDDEKVNQIFNLFKRNQTFDINAAIKYNLSNKHFYDRFKIAVRTTSEYMDAEYVGLVNAMHASKDQLECLKLAHSQGVHVFDRTKYTPEHIKAILGASLDNLNADNIKKVYKLIADWTKVYGAPSPNYIRNWISNWNAAKNAMGRLKGQKAEDKAAAKARKKAEKRRAPSAETVFSNANADEGTEKVSIFSLFRQNRENRKRYKDTVKGIKADLKAGVSAADILAKVSDMKFTLEDIKAINSKTAQASVEEVSLTKEEKKAQKKKEKEKRKADRKAKGNLWERMNAGVEEFGDKAANAGTNFMTMLTHPIKTLKAAHKGSKEAFEEGKNSKKGYTSIIDLLQGIKGEVSNQTEEIKKQDFEDGKTPLWKKILNMIFGKSLVGGALKLIGVPLAVGLIKNKAWPWIKKTAWPWMYEKLLGDPNVKGDGLLGKFDGWFKEHVVPVLFGEKNEDGVWTKGWFSGAANFWEQKVSPFLFGRKGADGAVIEKGFIGKAQDWIKDASYIGLDGINLLASWLLNKNYTPVTDFARQYFGTHDFSQQDKGSSGFFKMILENWADGAGTMVEFMTKTILANLPDILVGLGKGIVDGIGAWFTGKNDTAAKNAVFKAYDFNQITNNAGSIETSVSSGNKLITVESHLGAIGGGNEQNPNYANNAADYGVAKNQVATGGKVSELVASGQKIYNNGMDVTDEMAELNEWWENRDTTDIELSKAVELARNNLVILPVDCFESEDEFAKYFDSVFGEGSVEYYGWDVLKSFHEPILVAQDSEAYKEIINRATRGERLGQAALKYILTGGKVGRALPALMRAGAKVLNTVAKLSGKMGMVGKIVGLGLKGVSWATTKVTNVVQSAAKFNLGQKVAQGVVNTTDNIAEFVAKHPWLQKNLAKITDFFTKLFGDETVLGKIGKFIGKPVNAVKGMVTSSKIAEKSAKFGKWICEKFPTIAGKAGGHAVGVALFFVEVALVTWAFLEGYGDAKNVLAINAEPSEGEALLAGLVNAANELLLGRIIPTSVIAQWFANEILIGWFNVKDEYTKKVKIAKERVDAYNAANNTDLSVKEYNRIFYPSAWQEMEKDFEKKNQAISDAWEKDGLGGALGQVGQNFVDFWQNWWTGLTSGRTLYGHGKYDSDKDHMPPAQLPTLDTSSMQPIYGTGHIDQRTSGMRYNAPGDTIYQTVADSGCGPAAAATVLDRYGRGKLEDAARFSLQNGYKEPNGGTYPGFFGDYLGANGIDTRYENDPNAIMNNLQHNRPVILMGSEYGTAKTPYAGADGSHYVVATGLDRHGNMIIEDPDSRRGATKYNAKDVLNNSSIAISTRAGGRGKKYKFGKSRRARYGRGIVLSPMFGKGKYTIQDIDRDGLQDLRLWKDPGTGQEKDGYVKALAKRIYEASRAWTDGLMHTHSQEIAEAAVYAGTKTGLDPAILLAIGIYESGFGTTPTAKNKLNFWGWNYNNVTWEEGATDFSGGNTNNYNSAFLAYAELLNKNYYQAGQTCLYHLYDYGNRTHLYSGEVNDITTDWVINVAYYMRELHKAVGQTDTNMSWHDVNGTVTPLIETAGKFYSTREGYTGSIDGVVTSGSVNTSGGKKESKSFVTMFTEWGKKLLKSTFGGFYDLLFGSSDDSSSSSSYSTTNGYYDSNGNWVSSGSNGSVVDGASTNATQFFLNTMGNVGVSAGYDDPYYRRELGFPHTGIDFDTYGVQGLPIHSPVDGTVEKVAMDTGTKGGYGQFVRVRDESGRYSHIFAHMIKGSPEVSEGQEVKRGAILGYSGNTGYSTGPHLHYEIDDTELANKRYDSGTLKWSINPDTQYDWSKYLAKEAEPQSISDQWNANTNTAEGLTAQLQAYGHPEMANMSIPELLALHDRYKTTYENRGRVPSVEAAKIEKYYNSIVTALNLKRLKLDKDKLEAVQIKDANGYNMRMADYNKYYKQVGDAINYYSFDSIAERELTAQARAERQAATQAYWDKISSDRAAYNAKKVNPTKFASKIVKEALNRYNDQIRGMNSQQVSAMQSAGKLRSISDYITEVANEYASQYPVPYMPRHGIGYDLANRLQDIVDFNASLEGLSDYIKPNDWRLQEPASRDELFRLTANGITEEELNRQTFPPNGIHSADVDPKEYGLLNHYYEYWHNSPHGDARVGYNYGQFWDEYMNSFRNTLTNAHDAGISQAREIAANAKYYDLNKIAASYGKGKGGAKNFKLAMQIAKQSELVNKLQKHHNASGDKKLQLASNQLNSMINQSGGHVPATDYGRGRRMKMSAPKGYGRALMPKINYSSSAAVDNLVRAAAGVGISSQDLSSGASAINYSKFLITILDVLAKIADNTEKLDRVVDLLRRYGPNLGIDTSGLGKGKSKADTARSVKATIQNHKTDPSWAFSAMNHMNQEAVSDNFMESVLALARE